MLNSEIQDDRLNCALSTLGQPCAECSLSHILITAKSNFHIFWAGKRHRHNDSWHTHRHTHWYTYKAWRYAYPFHMLRLPGKEHRPVKLVPALGIRLGMRLGVEGCSSSPSIGPIYHNKRTKETHLGLANVSVSIWLLKSQKWPPVCPPPPASVQWVVHGIINCKRTPVCLYNGGNCAATATALGVEPLPRHRSSLVDASPMGFSFTASAKGVCQCRGESSQSQNQSQSRVGLLSVPGSIEIGCHLCSIRLC